MQESNCDFVNNSLDDLIRPGLAWVDGNMIRPEEYVEIPEITEVDLARAVIKGSRKLDLSLV
ncbi:hypothetical protein KQ298_03435 [Synechococcus sp. CS-1330]|nr:hypothetical protein [Synechococcus sp. CS-1330]